MVAGLWEFGRQLNLRLGLRGGAGSAWPTFVSPMTGAAFLAATLHPLALFGMVGSTGLRVVGLALSAGGVATLIRFGAARWRPRDVSIAGPARTVGHWIDVLAIGLLVGWALIAMGPSTNADSLNYHLGVALQILHDGQWTAMPEWFHSRLAGAGETLIALGLAVGAEQFGSLLQWSGVAGIFGLLWCSPTNARETPTSAPIGAPQRRASAARIPAALAFVTSPVLLFLVSSQKPQALPVAMTSAALAIALYPDRRDLSARSVLSGFALICLLVATASQMKLNFLISGSIVGLLGFALLIRRGQTAAALVVIAAVFAVVVLPPAVWRHREFGGSYLDALLMPFPGTWPGYDAFTAYLREYRDSPSLPPLSFVVPSSTGLISTVLGLGIAAVVWLRPRGDVYTWTAVSAAVLVAALGAAVGQRNARFFLEPFVWILMGLTLQPSEPPTNRGIRALTAVMVAQGALVAALIGFSVWRSIPGALTPFSRHQVMASQADGYNAIEWASDALPQEAVVISGHASMALWKRKAFATDWILFTGNRPEDWAPYLARLKEGRVTHALMLDDPSRSPFRGCFKGVAAGPFMTSKATRNPLNAGAPYSAWLMNVDASMLPDCFAK
jgi:hypothetical protein